MAKIKQIDGLQSALDGKVDESLFDAQSILAAVTDDTPAAVVIAEQTVVGRITGGNIKALSVAEIKTLIDATATVGISKIPISSAQANLNGWITNATEALAGKVELATAAETATGTSDTLAVHPAGLKSVLDNFIAANDALVYKGVIDCSTNPNYPAASTGWMYKVSVAGKIGGASGPNVEVGDTLICMTDNSGGTVSAGDHATVGTEWDIIQVNIEAGVISSDTSAVGDLKIAVMDGTTGKIIKAGTKTIAELQSDLGVDETTLVHTVDATHAANTVFTITDFFLGHLPPANVKPIVNVNGIIIPNRATASFGLAWNASGTDGKDLSMILPYALDATGDTTTKDYIECTFASK